MRRTFLSLVMFAVVSAPTVHAAEPSAVARRATRTEHQVRITPTQLAPGETSIDIGPDKWSVQGYDLRALLARVFDIQPGRVQLDTPELVVARHGAESAARYDLSVDLNGDESDAAIQSMLRKALEDRFHLTASLETRPMDVYVLTAPAGAGPGMQAVADNRIAHSHAAAEAASDRQSFITIAARDCPGISSAGITAQAATVESLAAALEDNLGRLVVDETHLTRAFDFQLPEYHNPGELFSLLQRQLGLTVRLERREVQTLTAHTPAPAGSALVAGI